LPESQLDNRLLALNEWDELIKQVITISPSKVGNGNRVYVEWNDGFKSIHTSKTAHAKFPQKVIFI
jgi:hypothetical protein